MNKKLLLGIALIIIVLVVGLNFGQHLTLDNAKLKQAELSSFIESNFFMAIALYFVSYVAITALSIPGAAVVTLLGAAYSGSGLALPWYRLLVPSAQRLPF